MNAYEQRSDVRRNIRVALAIVLTALVAGQAWFAIDPQPGAVTRAVQGANAPFMSAWALLLLAGVAGTFWLSCFLIRSALPGKARGTLPSVLGGASPFCLVAGVLTGMLAEGAAIAVLLAMAAHWFTPKGAADGRPEPSVPHT